MERIGSLALVLIIGQAAACLGAAGFTTYIGDEFVYQVSAITTDAAGNTYLTGDRLIPQFPGSAAISGITLTDVFVTKLDASGRIVFTTALSGKRSDHANAIAVDPSGNIYIGGATTSPDFPLSKALQSTRSVNRTGFLVKFSPDGGTILYSTYFGGASGESAVSALCADPQGNLYVTGVTGASDFPHTPGMPGGPDAFHPIAWSIAGGAFVAKLAPAGDRILYAGVITGKTLGCVPGGLCWATPAYTSAAALAVDPAGNAYLAGNTNTLDLPVTPGALQPAGIGAFVAKVNAGGTGLGYLTYLVPKRYIFNVMADSDTTLNAISVDAAGNAYLAGATRDTKFPTTPDAVQPAFGGVPSLTPEIAALPDAFLAKLLPDGSGFAWATYLGGINEDAAAAVAVDAAGGVWASGITNSAAFPNANGWFSGSDFLVRVNPGGSALTYSARYPSATVSQALALDPAAGLVHAAGSAGVVVAIAAGQPVTSAVFGITNAAGEPLTGRITPGEVISIYGAHLGPATPVSGAFDASGFLPTTMEGVTVTIAGHAAPLLYVSDTQINAVVPVAASWTEHSVTVVTAAGAPPPFRAMVVDAAPGIFTHSDGSAAALNQDNSINSPANPARPGSIVSVWATGAPGFWTADGQMLTAADNQCLLLCHIEAVSGEPIEVRYAGSAPGMVTGITQINFRLPNQLLGNTFNFSLRINSSSSAQTFVYTSQ